MILDDDSECLARTVVPEYNFSGGSQRAFAAMHTQLGKYNQRHHFHHHNQHVTSYNHPIMSPNYRHLTIKLSP